MNAGDRPDLATNRPAVGASLYITPSGKPTQTIEAPAGTDDHRRSGEAARGGTLRPEPTCFLLHRQPLFKRQGNPRLNSTDRPDLAADRLGLGVGLALPVQNFQEEANTKAQMIRRQKGTISGISGGAGNICSLDCSLPIVSSTASPRSSDTLSAH